MAKPKKAPKTRRPTPYDIRDIGDGLGEVLAAHLDEHEKELAADLKDRVFEFARESRELYPELRAVPKVAFTQDDLKRAVNLATPYVFEQLKRIITLSLTKK
jgi:SAM-dependent methyltransferase